ncbi:MAG: ABC transporter substrate-binding protein [SAR324 cluster bacterium]|nr:ABC transporter substrate-binding protein [SAR324 cluster bacterium]
MRTLTLAVILILGTSFLSYADEKAEVLQLAKSRIDRVVGLLRSKGISKVERNKKIITIINPIFDFALMAKISLCRKHWRPLSAQERKEFIDLFVLRLQESYLDKLDLYTDEEVVVEEAVTVKKRIHVLTHLVTKDDKLEMVYKFYKSRNNWKIYDVVILGVSVVQTYRSQVRGILKNTSFADLMEQLRTKGGFTIPTKKFKKASAS